MQPVRDGFINSMQVYPFVDGALYQVYASPGQITDIGLQPGERVVTEGLQKVKDGILVRQKPDTSVPSGSAPAVKG